MAKQKNQIKPMQEEQTQIKSRFEEKQPTLSRNITLSQDRKWLIIRTIRTDIVHVNYLQKILEPGEMQWRKTVKKAILKIDVNEQY